MKYSLFVIGLGTGFCTLFSFSLNHSYAKNFSDVCAEISSCANVVAELTGQKYIFDAEVKGKIMSSSNIELTKENAELLFTKALEMNAYSRVPVSQQPGTFQILRQREARDSALPIVNCDQNTAPKLPEVWDLMTLRYQATNKEPQVMEDISRTSRSFMPANSRIIPVASSGQLLITDTAPNLKKLYELIRTMDVKPTAASKKSFEAKNAARAETRTKKKEDKALGGE